MNDKIRIIEDEQKSDIILIQKYEEDLKNTHSVVEQDRIRIKQNILEGRIVGLNLALIILRK